MHSTLRILNKVTTHRMTTCPYTLYQETEDKTVLDDKYLIHLNNTPASSLIILLILMIFQ